MKPLINFPKGSPSEKTFLHLGSEQIGIYFENYSSIKNIIRKNDGVKWSQTDKCWYVLMSQGAYAKL